jgi:hypothetical protein
MATKFEDGRDDIVCALMEGTSLEDAVESVVDNTVLWTLFYGLLPYDSTVATIYTGEVEGIGYLPPSQSEDCDCDPVIPQVGCLTGLLKNCGFENALGSEWELVSGTGSLVRKTGVNAHDGTYGMGFSATEQAIWFKQEFVAPGDYSRIEVDYWHRATSGLIVKVDGVEKFNDDWLEIDANWKTHGCDITPTINEGDVIEIRLRLHSTYSLDSVNVVLS